MRALATRAVRPVLVAAFAAVCTVLLVSVISGAWPYSALGNADPGALVRIGTPVLRLLADACAAATIGSLACAAYLTPPEFNGPGVRTAGRFATVWAGAAGALIPFDVADQTGQSLAGPQASAVSTASVTTWQLWSALETPIAWLVTAWLALGIAIACRLLTRRRALLAALCVALLAVFPVVATGHGSSETGHDIATGALLLHVPLALLWVGVLFVLTRAHWRTGLPVDEVIRRYRRLAGWCWSGLAASGLVIGWFLVPSPSGSAYSGLLLVKIAVVAALGWLGVRVRRTLALRSATGRLAVVELVLLGATLGVSVGLTHLPPPLYLGHPVSPQQTLLGFNLTVPPTVHSILLGWRFEPVFACLAVLLAALYLARVRRIRRSGRSWPIGRTVSWCLGCFVLLIATNSGIARYGAAMFSYEIACHMLLAMIAPVLLVLGSPVTLAPQRWGAALRRSSTMSVLTHPLLASGLFLAAPFLLYRTGLFDAAVRFHWAHLLIDVVSLAIGYLFAQVTIGLDPVPGPLPALARTGLLLVAMPVDVVFAALVFSSSTVIGNGRAAAEFYSSLALPWVPDLLADQHFGGMVALVLGELALVTATIALLCRWHRFDDEAEDAIGDLTVAVGAARSRT